jgi:hypothetical protein
MRCVLVNGARLKGDCRCCYCRSEIGDRYVREISTRRVYCGQDCYFRAVGAPTPSLDYRPRPVTSWRANQ